MSNKIEGWSECKQEIKVFDDGKVLIFLNNEVFKLVNEGQRSCQRLVLSWVIFAMQYRINWLT